MIDGGPWFPKEYEVLPKVRVGRLRSAGKQWQIYSTGRQGSILIVERELHDKWVGGRLVGSDAFSPIRFGAAEYVGIECPEGSVLIYLPELEGFFEIEASKKFAIALRESRLLDKESNFGDSIYVENICRLLPTWSLETKINDDVVLGRWLTGGVEVSAHANRRISVLARNVDTLALDALVTDSGIPVSNVKDDLAVSIPAKGTGAALAAGFSLPGRTDLERFINEHIVEIVRFPERYKKLGVDFPAAIVLHGPPGCGKTYAVDKLIEYLGWPSYSIDSNSVGSPYIHDTSKKIAGIFEKAIDSAPSVLIIDEMESYVSDRKDSGTGSHRVEEVAEFLRRIPEAIKKQVLIFGMTNMISSIDPAILRRGRFDHVLEVGMATSQEIESMLLRALENIPCDGDLGLVDLAHSLEGRPISDAAFVVREGARLAAKTGRDSVDGNCLRLAFGSLPPTDRTTKKRIGFVSEERP